ncbi:heterokaryon incompatibility protein-domain-containing protein [Cercophora scortea]|uniref:Heterokaryon incompatibility protein-domain-containing protein n=1 Tax=Cercophora scortea TaxID=314031 RepID=A0AAE0MDX4_9PEZI|nr:heterokaryon incompatibility protein-domain-containing protein [Cercophora scortea]
MRLINTSTLLPEEFFGQSPPPYAILSHTWGLEEVSYHDLREGFAKLQQFCQQASADGFQYCWMDTCCIDKSNASELSEAINSHFAWYQGSSVCHVYLKDVKFEDGHITDEPNIKRLEQARWFTRGWTLQELIAPTHVVFFDLGWQRIGTKAGLAFTLQLITGVSQSYLSGGVSQSALALCSVAERMSWAAKRSTTRVEDIAYCLVGLFNVRMSVLYGEGTRAFWRLQREILKGTTDQSLLAWRSPEAHTMPGPSCDAAKNYADLS